MPGVTDWETRLAELWASFDDLEEQDFLARMDDLVAELPDNDPIGLFERGGARDSMGQEDLAVPLYRQALELGLDGERRRQAVIQLASSLRNIGNPSESVALLAAEQQRGSDDLDDAVAGFLALALADSGREREAVSVALAALAPHLPSYQRSLGNYARALVEESN